ncbi:MAG: 4-hydroxy-tetrahydrodipicolinate reductase [Clostridia bacterium]|nr:4-hydroxy-tetrahydrodipicolinate reductase [Clostridia bacterium]MBQ8290769.1 4-hydroxy-tetrahydrodipicolinate reductase [Clostridia bacterium]
MNILLNGFSGFMGSEVVKLASAGYRDARVTVGVDPRPNGNTDIALFTSLDDITDTAGIDCIIDFSHHSCVCALLDFAKENSIPTVVCTTGHTEDELRAIRQAALEIPVFFSANMSLGVALLVELAKRAALAMPEAEIEIIEKHHNRKLDAPSGTALMIANALTEVRPEAYTNLGRSGNGKRTREEIGIHAIRMGNIVGEHEVIIGTQNQTITLKHEAHSRALFAEGAIAAAEFLVGMKAGLYDMKSIVSGNAHDSAFSEN